MKKYTFRIGNKLAYGICAFLTVAAETPVEAVRLVNEQLFELMDPDGSIELPMDFGLTGKLVLDTTVLNLSALEYEEPILPFGKEFDKPEQLSLALEGNVFTDRPGVEDLFFPVPSDLRFIEQSAA